LDSGKLATETQRHGEKEENPKLEIRNRKRQPQRTQRGKKKIRNPKFGKRGRGRWKIEFLSSWI